MWTTTDLIKGLWLFRQASLKEPKVWWNHHVMVVFGARAPDEMDADMQWQLSELHWVYVREDDFGEPYWRLQVSGS